MATKTASKGTTIGREDSGTPGTYNTIASVEDMDFSRNGETIETTNHDSATLVREYIGGLQDATLSLELAFDETDTEHAGLETDFVARTVDNYQITLPTTQTYTFAGIITSLGMPLTVDGKIMLSVEIQITGAITIA